MAMDYDLERALAEAIAKVGPVFEKDPDELAARKRRRRMAFMRRPPRAWCLAVRACDTRMTAWKFAMSPCRFEAWDAERQVWRRREHEVTLESAQLRWLCRPVGIPKPGVTWKEAAEMLGVHPAAVHYAIKHGAFSVRYIKGLGGSRGRPVPVVYTDRLLDPAGIPLGRMADVEWGTMWRWASDCVPDDVCQTIVRRPVYRVLRGETVFRGWRWVCPGCGGEVTRIYYPLPALLRARFVKVERPGEVDEIEAPPPAFACAKCHDIHTLGRINSQGWDELVAHLSGGLLYGHEVKRPKWWTVTRKRAYKARPGRKASRRGMQIESFLVGTELSCAEIAKRLGLAKGTVRGWLGRIYKRRGVRRREELRKVVRATAAPGEAKAAG